MRRILIVALALLAFAPAALAQKHSPVPDIIDGTLNLGTGTTVRAGSLELSGPVSAVGATLTGTTSVTTLNLNSGITLGTGIGPGSGGGTVTLTTPNGSNIEINPQGTGTIDLNAATTIQNGLTVYGAGGTVSGAIPQLIFGEYGISGTVTGANASESTLLAPSDTADASGAGGATMSILNVLDNAGGVGMKGGREALGASFTLYNPSSNVDNGAIYVGGVFNSAASSNDNGTSTVPSGAITALNSVATIHSGATYFSGVASYEADVGVFDPTGVMDKHGIMIVQLANDAAHGSRDDIAFVMGNQSNAVGWNTGISFGSVGGAFPVDAAGTLIAGQAAGGAGFTVTNGIDWHLGTFTGDSWNDGHVQLTGTGHIAVSTAAPSLTAGSGCGAGATLDATASDLAGTVTPGSGATTCTITFHAAFATAPHCSLAGWTGVAPYIVSESASALVVQSGTNKFSYSGCTQ